jgi:hypothetical protein
MTPPGRSTVPRCRHGPGSGCVIVGESASAPSPTADATAGTIAGTTTAVAEPTADANNVRRFSDELRVIQFN